MKRGTISINENKVFIELVDGTVWVTKTEIAKLLGVFAQTVSTNLREIFKNKELFEHEVTCIHNYTNDKGVNCKIEFYNLDVIIALSFRMKGDYCRLFREWVREQIKQSITDNRRMPIVIQLGNTAILS